MLPTPPYARSDGIDDAITEIDQRDAYGVIMAAGLIKSWYADLRQPIFPQSTYKDLKRMFGDPDDLPSLERLTELFSPTSEWSILPTISREIVTRHLLPLLAAIAARQDANKMNAENLAVCFAPALLCGPDQMEDAKVSSIIRRIIMVAVEYWPSELGKNCIIDPAAFSKDLALPKDPNDWEDPLEKKVYAQALEEVDEKHETGIILQDNEAASSSDQPPPLPPRWSEKQPLSPEMSSDDSATKRKPAPPLMVPPRYSTIVPDGPSDVAESPVSYSAVVDGFAPPRSSAVADGFAHPRPSEWESVDEKKSGTNSAGEPPTPTIELPKRKALTREQIGNAETAATQIQTRSFSDGRMAMPGMTGTSPIEPVRRKPVQFSRDTGEKISDKESETASPTSTNSPTTGKEDSSAPSWARRGSVDPLATVSEFRRPSLPASANRNPTINSLARPVYPSSSSSMNRPPGAQAPAKSTSLPVPGPKPGSKPRTPSAGLLRRMPSFEPSQPPPKQPQPAQNGSKEGFCR